MLRAALSACGSRTTRLIQPTPSNFSTLHFSPPTHLHSSSAAITTSIPSLPSIFSEFILSIKRTFQPSLLVRKRRHGFLARLGKCNGKKILKRRMNKGRKNLTA